MNEEMKFEVGGQICLNGVWCELVQGGSDGFYYMCPDGKTSYSISATLRQFVKPEHCRAPLKPYKWLLDLTDEQNRALTEKYGDPTERVYDGEDPREFGLQGETLVLFCDGQWWSACGFDDLDKGEIWRKMPICQSKGGEA